MQHPTPRVFNPTESNNDKLTFDKSYHEVSICPWHELGFQDAEERALWSRLTLTQKKPAKLVNAETKGTMASSVATKIKIGGNRAKRNVIRSLASLKHSKFEFAYPKLNPAAKEQYTIASVHLSIKEGPHEERRRQKTKYIEFHKMYMQRQPTTPARKKNNLLRIEFSAYPQLSDDTKEIFLDLLPKETVPPQDDGLFCERLVIPYKREKLLYIKEEHISQLELAQTSKYLHKYLKQIERATPPAKDDGQGKLNDEPLLNKEDEHGKEYSAPIAVNGNEIRVKSPIKPRLFSGQIRYTNSRQKTANSIVNDILQRKLQTPRSSNKYTSHRIKSPNPNAPTPGRIQFDDLRFTKKPDTAVTTTTGGCFNNFVSKKITTARLGKVVDKKPKTASTLPNVASASVDGTFDEDEFSIWLEKQEAAKLIRMQKLSCSTSSRPALQMRKQGPPKHVLHLPEIEIQKYGRHLIQTGDKNFMPMEAEWMVDNEENDDEGRDHTRQKNKKEV